ncbi:MAG: hypothetical protein K9J12_02900 [Melioribacteraceae bacterium]|nr:hypothetical protein [Melioribacteraceae bacterium]MCF8414316.1 hypothetical protein [Melioribacteraceae bacterium]MCF8431977.1 hypothetical protein [Melioribacteraceae bacterium]
MDENNSAKEQLDFIKRAISDSKNIVLDNGIGFIVWGIIIIAGLIYTYIDVVSNGILRNDYVWIILISGGWSYNLVEWNIHKKKKRVSTFSGKILGSLWLSVGIALTILGIAGTFTGAIDGVFVSAVLSCVLGVGFFVTAQIFNYKEGLLLSTLWWIGALIMFIYPGLYVLILMSAMMLFLQVVPGIVLYKRYKKEKI